MDKKAMVIEAVNLAKKQGVNFEVGTPTFRSKAGESRFCIVIKINTGPNSAGTTKVDEHFDALNGHDVISLANYLINTFNELNISDKAEPV
ncbi:hypothetical protein OQJ19_11965 [Fluoribacter gormanii]|uniref:hypothetical protein n=1 Tax=Fluoribacter gormanii TaxID=464 RepID=UPI001041BA1B|nr:hypothetical protein [Fluoribacter gormanii]MCW8471360.1 hypothetical protein [Fluoribacter gormanii]